MNQIDFYALHSREVERIFPGLSGRRAINEILRRMINALIADLIQTSQQRILDARVQTSEDVRNAPPLIAFSDGMAQQATVLKRFLRENLYRHYLVNRMNSKARRIVVELYACFTGEQALLPPNYRLPVDGQHSLQQQARQVADYIAGMTDRYAIREHRRLFLVDEGHL
jgi:dGTPase